MGSNVSLSDYEGKYVVMMFYPLDFTFVCPTEIINFSERAKGFEAVGAQVVAVSVDSVFSHLAWTKTDRKKGGLGDMQIPLVADLTKETPATTVSCLRTRASRCAACSSSTRRACCAAWSSTTSRSAATSTKRSASSRRSSTLTKPAMLSRALDPGQEVDDCVEGC